MPNYKVFSDSQGQLNALIYGQYASGDMAAKTDSSGYLYVKSFGPDNVPQNLPYTAFGDLQVSQLEPKAGWTFAYNVNPDMVNLFTSGTGTITQSGGMAVLKTGTTSGSWSYINTYYMMRYLVGQGSLIRFTAIYTAGVSGSKQILGFGDDSDGLFFGYNGSSFGILRRQAGVENWTPQTAWNIDKMDGTGPSGMILDQTKGNVYQIQFQWLGYGAIDFAIENASTGSFVPVHQIKYANANTLPSILNPSLPLTARVYNSGTPSNIILQTPSAMGFHQGTAGIALNLTNTFANSKTTLVSGLDTAIFSIRNVSTFQGKTNRVQVKVAFISYSADGTKDVTMRIARNATIGGTPVWNDINTNASVVQYDTSGTTATGGRNLLYWGETKIGSNQMFPPDNVPLYMEPGETLTIAANSAATADMICALTWSELF